MLVSVAVIIYAILIPNKYEAKAILYPVSFDEAASPNLRGYSGIASLAGINFPSASKESNTLKALEKLKSLSFFEENLMPNIFLPHLMAFKSWDKKNNTVILDNNKYDSVNNLWVRDIKPNKGLVPSSQESYSVFKSNHFKVNQDTNTGFIFISVKHQSPFIAKEWVELVVGEINNYFRNKDKSEAEAAVAYLNNQIIKTNYSEVKSAMAQLLQQEVKKLTLIEANEFYILEYIDKPVVMEKISEPNRSLICIIGAILGIFFGTLIVLIRHIIIEKI